MVCRCVGVACVGVRWCVHVAGVGMRWCVGVAGVVVWG